MILLYTACCLVLKVSGLAYTCYGIYFWSVSSCTLCQPSLIVGTSDKKYKSGVSFKVLVLLSMLHGYVYTCMHYNSIVIP